MTQSNSADTRRARFLREMAIGPVWIRRSGAVADTSPVIDAPTVAAPAIRNVDDTVPPLPRAVAAPSAWDEVAVKSGPPQPQSSDDQIAAMDWSALEAAVAGCTRCALCETRTRTVFGSGDRKALWLMVGEGPGRNEDLQGLPFVGPAGKLLDNLLQSINLGRAENTYIANVVKCRPIDADGRDRAPSAEESAACRPYLERQIALLKPATILALGKVAALTGVCCAVRCGFAVIPFVQCLCCFVVKLLTLITPCL